MQGGAVPGTERHSERGDVIVASAIAIVCRSPPTAHMEITDRRGIAQQLPFTCKQGGRNHDRFRLPRNGARDSGPRPLATALSGCRRPPLACRSLREAGAVFRSGTRHPPGHSSRAQAPGGLIFRYRGYGAAPDCRSWGRRRTHCSYIQRISRNGPTSHVGHGIARRVNSLWRWVEVARA
jgi:hypothetical protein